MSREPLIVTVLGCGTSSGVPTIGCDCDVCTSDDPRNNRLRSSLYLRKGDTRMLVDCGPDFRQQALREKIRRVDALFVTHTHSDHVSGIDDLRAINWAQGKSIDVLSTKESLNYLRQRYDYCFNPPQVGGGVPKLRMTPIRASEPFCFENTRITAIPAMHGALPILGFRFDDFVYLTDVCEIPKSSDLLIEGVDTLALSALRHRSHTTHFSVGQAIEAAQRFSPRRVYFTHMAHDIDYERDSAALPEGFAFFHDGLSFELR